MSGALKIKVGGSYVTIPRGPKGETGATGPANSLAIGTVTTTDPGTTATATIVGTPPSQTLSLTIPKGDVGPPGSVDTVNGQPGPDVVLTAADVNAVNSVNGKTGTAVTLASSDVGAMPTAGGTFTGRATLQSYSEKTTSVSSAATTTLDCSLGNTHVVTLTQNTTLAFSNVDTTASTASSISVILIQDATGGRTVTWPPGTKWPDGVAPVLETAANAINVVTFMTYNGGTTWLGFLAGRNMS